LFQLLADLRILVLEDEFLIAMDIEQLCRDYGAKNVVVVRSPGEIEQVCPTEFDAAIVDLLLDGVSTLEFAARLRDNRVPFVFASGYTDNVEVSKRFPGVVMVGKPYSGSELIAAVAAACGRGPGSSGV
jgi:CheY-like chemotaxis protein